MAIDLRPVRRALETHGMGKLAAARIDAAGDGLDPVTRHGVKRASDRSREEAVDEAALALALLAFTT